MAKGGKFTKLMKKLSFGKTSQTNTSSSEYSSSLRSDISLSSSSNSAGSGLHPVYVGISRRRYMVPSNVVENPLFRQLAGNSDGAGEITVGCEVVLFDHLLWMLENADPQPTSSSSLNELVAYYACC